jgi:2-hydroxy-6-oxonona-2,4-dienedioate hydrolase
MVYDARSQSGAFGVFPIRQITAPTLSISADDDLYRTTLVARFGASVVPGARLLVYESGGHLLLGRGPEMWPLVADFLRD